MTGILSRAGRAPCALDQKAFGPDYPMSFESVDRPRLPGTEASLAGAANKITQGAHCHLVQTPTTRSRVFALAGPKAGMNSNAKVVDGGLAPLQAICDKSAAMPKSPTDETPT